LCHWARSRFDVRSDNGPEFVAEAVEEWVRAVGTKTTYIERGRRKGSWVSR